MQVSDIRRPDGAAAGAITDVAGLRVGHYTDPRRPTGCTVVLAGEGATCGVDVRGAAPGTRETDLLDPVNAVDQVHAVLLAGGSAFGLDAAGGVVAWLEAQGIGLPVGPARVPIVPAAILFDLWVGDASIRPDARAGRLACEAASEAPPAEGSVGAGAGATVGKLWGIERAMKGGVGTASLRIGGATVGALIVVNAIGDVVDPSTGRPIAGARSEDGRRLVGTTASLIAGDLPPRLSPGMATTIGCVATDLELTKAQCRKLAQCAHDGLARSIDPVHTAFDGDTLFALATGRSRARVHPVALGAAIAAVTATAVLRAVRAAEGLSGPGLPTLPSLREFEREAGR
ncbi:MAG: peptidase S58 family protein [Burkholderiales bacterium]|nr:MAG: peptidase S58 family protein [Burkholderiales bacterium]